MTEKKYLCILSHNIQDYFDNEPGADGIEIETVDIENVIQFATMFHLQFAIQEVK